VPRWQAADIPQTRSNFSGKICGSHSISPLFFVMNFLGNLEFHVSEAVFSQPVGVVFLRHVCVKEHFPGCDTWVVLT